MKEKILIIGAGQAGMQIASSLRDEGYAGDVTIVGEEAYAPYQRPPLSKAYLAGDMDEESLEFHKEKRGKIEIKSTCEVKNSKDLSLAYTPGVAEP
ncbi:MAG: FAD-dependent oxidoreductase, partial [Aurantimicrobium sp.]